MGNETVANIVRDFDAMAAECGGLEAATIHAMTVRLSVAHAREVELKDAYIREADRRISVLASLLNQSNVDRFREVEALTKGLRVAVIALAHASETDATNRPAYQHVSDLLAGTPHPPTPRRRIGRRECG